MSDDARGRYATALSDGEVARYRFMAESAREREAEWWRLAGIVEGASVLDLGCGPGLVAVEMSVVESCRLGTHRTQKLIPLL